MARSSSKRDCNGHITEAALAFKTLLGSETGRDAISKSISVAEELSKRFVQARFVDPETLNRSVTL